MVNKQELVEMIKKDLDAKFPIANLKLLPPIYISEILAELEELGYQILKKENYLDTAKLYTDMQNAVESGLMNDAGDLSVDILQILQSLTNSNWKLIPV